MDDKQQDNVTPLRTEPDHARLARENAERAQRLGVQLSKIDVLHARLDKLAEFVLNKGQYEAFEYEFQQVLAQTLDHAEQNAARQRLLAGTPMEGQMQLPLDERGEPDVAGRDV